MRSADSYGYGQTAQPVTLDVVQRAEFAVNRFQQSSGLFDLISEVPDIDVCHVRSLPLTIERVRVPERH